MGRYPRNFTFNTSVPNNSIYHAVVFVQVNGQIETLSIPPESNFSQGQVLYGYSTQSNQGLASESVWNTFVDTTSVNSPERAFKTAVAALNAERNSSLEYFYCTLNGALTKKATLPSGYIIQSGYDTYEGFVFESFALLF